MCVRVCVRVPIEGQGWRGELVWMVGVHGGRRAMCYGWGSIVTASFKGVVAVWWHRAYGLCFGYSFYMLVYAYL